MPPEIANKIERCPAAGVDEDEDEWGSGVAGAVGEGLLVEEVDEEQVRGDDQNSCSKEEMGHSEEEKENHHLNCKYGQW